MDSKPQTRNMFGRTGEYGLSFSSENFDPLWEPKEPRKKLSLKEKATRKNRNKMATASRKRNRK